MLKGKDIIGRQIIAHDSGEKIETVVDLIFDLDQHCLLGFLVDSGGWLSNPKVLPLYLVHKIEADAIVIPWKEAIAPASTYATISDVLAQNDQLNGTHIITPDGRDLGTLPDLYFDEDTGDIEHLQGSVSTY